MAFLASECHFLKRVMTHPERDIEIVRVIDQPTPCEKPATPKGKVPETAAVPYHQSSLESLDLATKLATPKKQGRGLQFNDTVEVYYYPENKEQHEHHSESEFEEEIDDVLDGPQEQTDPSFEELLCTYMRQQVIPRYREQQRKQSLDAFATPSKRFRRERANSQTSVAVPLSSKFANEESDSDKSSSTNENTFPTTASGPNSGAETCVSSPPNERKIT